MIELLEQRRSKLAELCRKHHVKTLEVFGSVVAGGWDPQRSDLDFLVEYLPLEDGEHAGAYFGLLHDLEDLFQRSIHLVMDRAIRSQYFRKGVEKSRRTIYAA